MIVNGYTIEPGANLTYANLYGADLTGADLSGADLYRAKLPGAILNGAILSGTKLFGADLVGANLYRANLPGADLFGADLTGANLYGANLYGAKLSAANLFGAILIKVKNFHLLPVQDPRGYIWPHAVNSDDGWLVCAGCRRFTIPQAIEHWSDPVHGYPEIAKMYLDSIEWLIEKTKAEK